MVKDGPGAARALIFLMCEVWRGLRNEQGYFEMEAFKVSCTQFFHATGEGRNVGVVAACHHAPPALGEEEMSNMDICSILVSFGRLASS